ncbi:Myc-type, basic helix-loop-helix (bHLH) domain-containing protein [Cynara cardunculus var. scolymus]|uniref:Myc-type, basic helix-loop-helix (BHLH) domain-containing protein n=1 Tax=Cynara cardunculus var. scolymus TaxID=59895 RepID=A0A124SGI0_CYNCS|nr:Myc-type, basic helix-loop-helix (bHLH) domain-containing protein [Cynara cardunculus var. scolymus]
MSNILPSGIGSYSINHISYINQSHRSSKPEAAQSSSSDRNDENSKGSSYTAGNGNGFKLWEESAGNKGKTGKENIAGNRHIIREGDMKIGGVPWITSPSQSSSIHNHPTTNIGYPWVKFFSFLHIFYKVLNLFLAAEFSISIHSAQKNQSFVDMLKSAKPSQENVDDNDGEFVIKTETSSHRKVKVEPKPDQTPNILRSKHSATEQRRRSKINDRHVLLKLQLGLISLSKPVFSMLRDIIPHGDQKRDKASFLLEVIEYIQFLQEKLHKYEDSYQGWSSEPPKTIPWNSQRPTQVPNGASGPAMVYAAAKLDENNISIAPNIPREGQNLLDTDMSRLDSIKEIDQSTKEASSFPMALQPNICAAAPLSRHEPEFCHSRLCATDCSVKWDNKLKEQELIIENGTISISTIYSQGLLSTLTQALQSSGVELSRASISIQIDLGKRAYPNSSTPNFKKTQIVGVDASGREEEENDKGLKRLKTSIND